jgi:hypothetical protein
MQKRELAMRMRTSELETIEAMQCDCFSSISECENGFALPALIQLTPWPMDIYTKINGQIFLCDLFMTILNFIVHLSSSAGHFWI